LNIFLLQVNSWPQAAGAVSEGCIRPAGLLFETLG